MFVFLLLFCLVTAIGAVIALSQGQLVSFISIGLPFSVIGLLLGVITLNLFAYEVAWDDTGLDMLYVFRKERVRWDEIISYKNILVRQNFKGGVNLWIKLNYRQATRGKIRSRMAIILLPSLEGFESFSAKYYTTILDKYVPDKSRNK